MKKRTQDEIARQIEGLKKQKEALPQHSMFGDANWEKIDAQVGVLEGKKVPDDFYEDESAEEFEDGDNEIYFAAQEAEDWLFGSNTDDLFDSELMP